MLPALLEDLKRPSVISSWNISSLTEGIMWGEILAILEEKAKAGLDVRVMFDGMNEMTTLSYDYIERLHKVGIKSSGLLTSQAHSINLLQLPRPSKNYSD